MENVVFQALFSISIYGHGTRKMKKNPGYSRGATTLPIEPTNFTFRDLFFHVR